MYFTKDAVERAMSECGIYCPIELMDLMTEYSQVQDCIVMPFGKHKGLPAKVVAQKYPGYAKWCIKYLENQSDFDNSALIKELTPQ